MIVLGVPVLSRFDLLAKCIASARAGTVKPDRVIVIDNSGGKCPANLGCELYIPARNIGVAGAWNYIMDLADPADTVIISNDDVEFDSGSIETLTAFSLRDHVGVFSALERPNSFACFILNRKCFDDVGRFDEQLSPLAYFEDDDYRYRMTLKGWIILHSAAVRHVGSATKKAMTADELRAHEDEFAATRKRYYQKWGGYPGKETFATPFNRL